MKLTNGSRSWLRFEVLIFGILTLSLAASAQSSNTDVPSEPYVWRNVVIGGGGFVTGIITHPRQKDLMYARTDVGGAYRWDSTARQWIPLTDWIGMADANLTGIESIAVDPSHANFVYLAAGTYTRGAAAILCSTNQGKTFSRISVPFKMGANEAGRSNGERLAVDPNDGKILFFGSRRDGLWRSEDRGVTWKKVESFPSIATNSSPAAGGDANPNRRRFGPQPVGIVCVIFDPASGTNGQPTSVIYAAVSTTETNFFVSRDGGNSWRTVEGQPVGLCPNHVVLAADGMFYLSYGKEAGPNVMTDGAIWKFNPKDNSWVNITPVKPGETGDFGYGAVTVDPQNPNVIMATTFARWRPGDEIFRSTNGGINWMPILSRALFNHSNAPYTASQKPHWMGDIEINPTDSNQVLFTTGYGIWSCADVTAADAGRATHWEFFNHGLEETVPLGLISPSEGAHLLSALGDQDGFRHDDLTNSPSGAFHGPRFSNGDSIAFAAKQPNIIARTGTGGEGMVHAAISFDGGINWKTFASEPPDSDGGTIALSADGNTIVWTPRRGAPHWSTNEGVAWTACNDLASRINIVADPINASRFYAYDAETGAIYISTNCAISFKNTLERFPRAQEYPGGFGGSGGAGAMLYAAPGCEGDLWLAFRSRGLYHSTNSGTSFMKVSAVSEAYSLGFGKAAPSKDCSALYLAGMVAGNQGIFRSDDAGEHWVRINDDEHQYGWINHVTGDPRLYGRVYFGTGGRGIIYGEPTIHPADQIGETQ